MYAIYTHHKSCTRLQEHNFFSSVKSHLKPSPQPPPSFHNSTTRFTIRRQFYIILTITYSYKERKEGRKKKKYQGNKSYEHTKKTSLVDWKIAKVLFNKKKINLKVNFQSNNTKVGYNASDSILQRKQIFFLTYIYVSQKKKKKEKEKRKKVEKFCEENNSYLLRYIFYT